MWGKRFPFRCGRLYSGLKFFFSVKRFSNNYEVDCVVNVVIIYIFWLFVFNFVFVMKQSILNALRFNSNFFLMKSIVVVVLL